MQRRPQVREYGAPFVSKLFVNVWPFVSKLFVNVMWCDISNKMFL